jgi:hypothetical protein
VPGTRCGGAESVLQQGGEGLHTWSKVRVRSLVLTELGQVRRSDFG